MREGSPHGLPPIQRVGEEANTGLGRTGYRVTQRSFLPKQASQHLSSLG